MREDAGGGTQALHCISTCTTHPYATAQQPWVNEDTGKVAEGGGGKKVPSNANVISIRLFGCL